MKIVYIMIGLPGSGKSTWSRMKVKEEPNIVIVNRDSFRQMINGYYLYTENLEPLVHEMTITCLEKAIVNGFNVIIDETNIDKQHRAAWLSHCKAFDKRIFVYCKKPNPLGYRMLDSRNISREQWQTVIDKMTAKFEEPSLDEGVDEIIEQQ